MIFRTAGSDSGHSTLAQPPSARGSGRVIMVLVASAAAISAAFVLAPGGLAARPGPGYASQSELVETVAAAFVDYWSSGARALSPSMAAAVDYWVRYHLAKAVLAAVLLAVLVVLGRVAWTSYAGAGPLTARAKIIFASVGGLIASLTLFASVLIMANLQGAIAPLSSLVSMVPLSDADPVLTGTLGQVRQQLMQPVIAGSNTNPALDVMIGDFARYHLTMAVIALVASATSVAVSVLAWRRHAGTSRSHRRPRLMLGSVGGAAALLALLLILIGVANALTGAHPAPALLAFFDGGF